MIGDGDGGLCDVIDLALSAGPPASNVPFFMRLATRFVADTVAVDGTDRWAAFQTALRAADSRAREESSPASLEWLRRDDFDWLDHYLKKFLRAEDRLITVIGHQAKLDRRSYLLNRLIVARLAVITAGYGPGAIRVRIDATPNYANPWDHVDADTDVIVRSGPQPRERGKLSTANLDVSRKGTESPSGITLDMLDMTRHAWWRIGSRDKMTGLKRLGATPIGTVNGLRKQLTMIRTIAGPATSHPVSGQPLPVSAGEWPENLPVAYEQVVELFRRAVDRAAEVPSPYVKSAAGMDYLDLDIAALLLDTTPSSVAYAVARSPLDQVRLAAPLLQGNGDVIWLAGAKPKTGDIAALDWISDAEIDWVLRSVPLEDKVVVTPPAGDAADGVVPPDHGFLCM